MTVDANKTGETRRVTDSASLWLAERGFKPVETEVPISDSWTADNRSEGEMTQPVWPDILKYDGRFPEPPYDVESVDDMIDEYDPSNDCPRCQGTGEVPTADYESYFGAMMKPCPACHGTLDGLGHGRLS